MFLNGGWVGGGARDWWYTRHKSVLFLFLLFLLFLLLSHLITTGIEFSHFLFICSGVIVGIGIVGVIGIVITLIVGSGGGGPTLRFSSSSKILCNIFCTRFMAALPPWPSYTAKNPS